MFKHNKMLMALLLSWALQGFKRTSPRVKNLFLVLWLFMLFSGIILKISFYHRRKLVKFIIKWPQAYTKILNNKLSYLFGFKWQFPVHLTEFEMQKSCPTLFFLWILWQDLNFRLKFLCHGHQLIVDKENFLLWVQFSPSLIPL